MIRRSLCVYAMTAIVLFGSVGSASARGRYWRQGNFRTPAATNTYRTQGTTGWNANNTWYNVPNNGNYAPPPYATSKSAFYQVGPVPAIGGVRSLPGWGGAR